MRLIAMLISQIALLQLPHLYNHIKAKTAAFHVSATGNYPTTNSIRNVHSRAEGAFGDFV